MQTYICSNKRIPSVYPEHHLQIDFFFLKQFIAIKINFIFLNCKVGDFQVVQLIALNEFLTMGGWKTGTENYIAYCDYVAQNTSYN